MNFKKVLLLLISIYYACTSWAHTVTYSTFINKTSITSNKRITLTDPKGSGVIKGQRKAIVRLIYGRESQSDVLIAEGLKWEFSVSFSIKQIGQTTDLQSSGSAGELKISRESKNGVFEDVKEIVLPNSESGFDILITNVSSTGNLSPVPNDIRFEVDLEVEQYEDLIGAPNNITHTYTDQGRQASTPQQHQMMVRWDYLKGAERYEIEWVYIDDKDLEAVGKTSAQIIANPNLFEKDVVRAETPDLFYNISTTYPSGFIVYRVRGVGRYTEGDYSHENYGDWGFTCNAIQQLDPFASSETWIAATNYVEDAKSKKIVKYFDNTLRTTQTLTNLSTDGVTLAASTFYDKEGRVSFNILPAPVIENGKFVNTLNKRNGLSEYNDPSKYDNESGPQPLSMTESQGAGHYFSSSLLNSSLPIMYKNFIPDAEGFPMVQTRYLNDPTGRPQLQTGVGVNYKKGSGHETMYYYATPTSTELHRLFGKNVGDARFYKKNIVKDPNGQFSVSYTDMAGRTIATAMLGDAPSNVTALNSNANETITVNLNDLNRVDPSSGKSITSYKVFNYKANSSYSIEYKLDDSQTTGLPEICVGCEYKLTIKVTDPNNEIIENETFTVEGKKLKSNCTSTNNTTPFPKNYTFTFNAIGVYTIEKTLEAITPEVQTIRDNIVNIPTWQTLLTDLKTQYATKVDATQCAQTCEEYAAYYIVRYMFNATAAERTAKYNEIIKNCDNTVKGATDAIEGMECNSLYNQMLDQLMPGGCLYTSTTWNWGTEIGSIQTKDGAKSGQTLRDYLEKLVQRGERDIAAEGAMVVKHPEYCHYTWCKETKDIRDFEVKLSALTLESIKTDPTSLLGTTYPNIDINTTTGVQTLINAIIAKDKATTNTKTSASFTLAIITNRLNELKWSSDDGSSKTPNDCPTGPVNFYNYVQQCGMLPGLVETEGDKEEKWMKIKALYFGIRSSIIENIKANTCNITESTRTALGDCALVPDVKGFLDIASSSDPQGSVNNWKNKNQDKGGLIWGDCYTRFDAQKEYYQQELIAAFPDKFGPNSSSSTSNLAALSSAFFTYKNSICGTNSTNPYGFIIDDNSQAIQNLQTSINTILGGSDKWSVVTKWAKKWNDVYVNEQYCTLSPCGEAINNYLKNYSSSSGTQSFTCSGKTYKIKTMYVALNGPINRGVLQLAQSPSYMQPVLVIWDSNADEANNNNKDIVYFVTNGTESNPIYFTQTPISVNSIYNTTTLVLSSCGLVQGSNKLDAMLGMSGINITETKTRINLKSTVEANIGVPETPEDLFNNCIKQQELYYETLAIDEWNRRVNEEVAKVINGINCIGKVKENMTVTQPDKQYHYTLYYYDQAGNLLQTVPPAGVELIALTNTDCFDATTKEWKKSYTGTLPDHALKTRYKYNSLQKTIWQTTPEAGEAYYIFDFAQRQRFSQNAKQKDVNDGKGAYSYTVYDVLGRTIEVGQLDNPSVSFSNLGLEQINDYSFPSPAHGTLAQYTKTTFSEAIGVEGVVQSNLRNRVSSVKVRNLGSTTDDIRTSYDYDIHGNVKTLYHEVTAMADGKRIIKVNYDYDLISNKVTQLSYQKSQMDQFYHRYEYDSDNRLTSVNTSEDGRNWERDVRYFYYLHGPLARVEVGADKVQGQDYHHTIQGWIKGVNMPGKLSHKYEPGKDGFNEGIATALTPEDRGVNRYVARDEFAYTLGYFNGDYKPINNTMSISRSYSKIWDNMGGSLLGTISGFQGLYNGNIAIMVTDIKSMMARSSAVPNAEPAKIERNLTSSVFHYDALHRIRRSIPFNFDGEGNDNTTGSWVSAVPSTFINSNDGTDNNQALANNQMGNNYTSYIYDPNGNLKSLNRFLNGRKIDALTYNYAPDPNNAQKLLHNRLVSVEDAADDSFTADGSSLDQLVKGSHTFTYDAIGNLVNNPKDNINKVDWSVYGKVMQVTRTDGKTVKYIYDAAGNRLSQEADGTKTVYIRDATGNVLSTYTVSKTYSGQGVSNGGTDTYTITQNEVHLYGSSRYGIRKFNDLTALRQTQWSMAYSLVANGDATQRTWYSTTILSGGAPNPKMSVTRGNKFFELSNHLGNVYVVVSDHKAWKPDDGGYYAAQVQSVTDYFPFGQEIATRQPLNNATGAYRYGFNGKENDKTWGKELIQDYGFRLYAPAIGRFLSVDPISASYPFYTPYQFAGNMPIWAADLDGLEPDFKGSKIGHTVEAVNKQNGKTETMAWNGDDWTPTPDALPVIQRSPETSAGRVILNLKRNPPPVQITGQDELGVYSYSGTNPQAYLHNREVGILDRGTTAIKDGGPVTGFTANFTSDLQTLETISQQESAIWGASAEGLIIIKGQRAAPKLQGNIGSFNPDMVRGPFSPRSGSNSAYNCSEAVCNYEASARAGYRVRLQYTNGDQTVNLERHMLRLTQLGASPTILGTYTHRIGLNNTLAKLPQGTRFSVVGTYKEDGKKHVWAGQITYPGQVSYIDPQSGETVNANYLNRFSEFQVVTHN